MIGGRGEGPEAARPSHQPEAVCPEGRGAGGGTEGRDGAIHSAAVPGANVEEDEEQRVRKGAAEATVESPLEDARGEPSSPVTSLPKRSGK